MLSSIANPKRLDKFFADLLTASTILKFLERESFVRRYTQSQLSFINLNQRVQVTFRVVKTLLKSLRGARLRLKQKQRKLSEVVVEPRKNSLWD